MADGLVLRVNGRDYAGWKRASVTRGIEAIAGSFELTVSDRWARSDEPWPINEEDECQILLGDVPVVTGYVDRVSLSFSGITVSGRDKTGALVDCSALPGRWEHLNVPLVKFAKDLAEPFGIAVSAQFGLVTTPIPKLTIDPGDSVFDVIERACRMAGVLPVATGTGYLLLTRAGSNRATTALVEGENILDGSSEFDSTGRFRRYVVMGQRQGTDETSGAAAASVRGECTDMGVERAGRVLVVRAEGSVTPASAKVRAQWEAKVRQGRAASVNITVQGWRQGDGSLWPVNALVKVDSRRLGIGGEMLITQATYGIDDGAGTTTVLSLKPPNALLPEPTIPAGKDALWKELSKVPKK